MTQLFQAGEMSNICKLCRFPDQKALRAAYANGDTDRQIGAQFHVSHAAAGRHRRAHLLAPMKLAAAALDKGRSAHQQREQQISSIAEGDPTVIASTLFTFASQAVKIQRLEDRLERMSQVAEQGGVPAAVAQLSAQALRAVEVGARLGGLRGFIPPAQVGQPGEARVFSISIHFANSNRTEEINIIETRPTRDAPQEDDGAKVGIVDGVADEV